MNYIKVFRKAGELTLACPVYLCEQAYNQLAIWQLYDNPQQMSAGLKEDIESLDRWEYLVTDDNNKLVAMMIFTIYEKMPHLGNKDILATHYSYSTVTGLLTNGYKWLKQIQRELSLPVMLTRQTGPMSIEHKIKVA